MKKLFKSLLIITCLSSLSLTALAQKEKTLSANQQQFEEFSKLPDDQPLIMVNFLKFKKEVAETGESGRAVYQKYIDGALPYTNQIGAEVLWYGKPILNLIGPENDQLWDAMFIIKYPNKLKFFELTQNQNIPNHLRTKGLMDSRLVVCNREGNFFTK